jgi:hypothetical protein
MKALPVSMQLKNLRQAPHMRQIGVDGRPAILAAGDSASFGNIVVSPFLTPEREYQLLVIRFKNLAIWIAIRVFPVLHSPGQVAIVARCQ